MDKVNSGNSSVKFQEFINPANIICHSNAASSEAVINELIDCVAENMPDLDCDQVRKAVFEREALFPTVIAPGLAMPHARIEGLNGLVVALATSEKGVIFGQACDCENIHVAVLVLSPADNPGIHLQLVSALAREFSDLDKISQLAELQSTEDIIRFFGVVPLRLSKYLTAGDLACGTGAVVLPTDSLTFALRKFAETRSSLLPVIDEDGKIQGIITLKDILRYNLPEGVLDGDDLSAIYNFRPYANMLNRADSILVSSIMEKEYLIIEEEEFAVCLLKIFLKHPGSDVLVVDKEQRLRGIVTLRDFCAKLLWE